MRPLLLLHLFYPDVAIEMIERLEGVPHDLLVTTTGPLPPPVAAALGRLPNRTEIVEVPNRGWDVGPLFAALPRIRAGGYDLVCKLHTKKGGSGYAAEWRDLFHESLLGDPALVARILAAFEAEPRLELVGPAALYKSAAQHQFLNGGRLGALLPALADPAFPPSDWGFFAGTMFWARTAMLERLAPLADFAEEGEARDGALAHAFERLFGLAPFAAGNLVGLVRPAAAEPLEVVAAPGTPDHEPILNTLVARAEATAGDMTPALAALIGAENPLIDYLRHGRDADALDPNPYFSSTWYNRINADVAAAGMHPLEHYLHHGAFEDRSTSPLFDMGHYMSRNPEIAAERLDPLRHFLETGLGEGQSAIPISEPAHDAEGDGPRRFYRHFDLEREKAFLDRLAGLPPETCAAAAAARFSIVMPAWNREAAVGEAIRSVLAQTHGGWELLVVDDGSTDGTVAAIEPFLADPRVRLIRGAHAGVSAARNLGLEAATGDMIAYLDSDNRWKPHFLEVMALFLAAEGLDAGYSALELRDDLGQLTGYHGDAFDWDACLERNYVDLNAFVHARRLFATLGGFDPALRRMVDWDLILRYGRDRRIGFAPIVGVDYRDGTADAARITVAEPMAYMKLVQAKHRGENPADVRLSFAIKIAAPEEEKAAWGDFHFAEALAVAIERLGHVAHVDFRDRWHVRPPAQEDVVIVLRGLIAYEPRPGQIAFLWSISHPDQPGLDEMERFARVYVASASAAALLAPVLRVPVTPLLQATDPARFRPPVTAPDAPDLLFVGNSRGVERPIVDWAIAAGTPPVLYGGGWDGTAAEPLVEAGTIANDALGALYAGAGAVLNDHWPAMRAFGYVSNRLFDVVGSGGRAISDAVPGIGALFGEAVAEVGDAAGFAAAATAAIARKGEVDRTAAATVAEAHSFDVRARVLVEDARALLGLASRSPATVPAAPRIRLRVHAIVPWSVNGPQSSAFLRLHAPLTDPAAHERIAFTMAPHGHEPPACDVCIVQRTALPSVEAADALALALGRQGATLVTDVDDAFRLIDGLHLEAERYRPLSAALDRAVALSAETWFASPALRAAYEGVAHRTALVPNALDPRLWRDFRAAPRAILQVGPVRMLYMGTHTHGPDLGMIRPDLDRLHETHAGQFELTVIGVDPDVPPAPWLRRLAAPADAIPYPRFVRWLRAQGPFDVGLAPLRRTPFNRAKSDVKLLDYAALGLLPVASEIDGYLADPALQPFPIRVAYDTGGWWGALAHVLNGAPDLAWRAQALTAHVWRERTTPATAAVLVGRLEALVRG